MTLGISDEEFDGATGVPAGTRRIDLSRTRDFTIGPVAVRPSLRTIEGPGGSQVIEPKVMQVLIALGREAGRILSRDDLIEHCWEGRVVGESSINRVISLLRSALRSVGGETVILENVPKVGYRVITSPDWDLETDAEDNSGSADEGHDAPSAPHVDGTAAPASSPARRWGAMRLAVAIAALLALVAGAYALWPAAAPGPVTRIKVAMLPLETSESVDPLYALGLESELRSQLARIGRLEVTSSESARQLFEEGLSADEICRKLGADYAWMGSLDIGADRVLLSANLIEAKTKRSAFKETLSSAPDAAQNLPMRTARAITAALGRPVSQREPDMNVSAGDYRLYLTALGLIKGRGIEQRRAALQILQEVTQRNPGFADGWAGLAKATFLHPIPNPTLELEKAERIKAGRIADKALSLDPDAVDALKTKAMLDDTPSTERLALLKRATQLDPGDSEAWFWRGIIQQQYVLEAESPVESATRMVEVDPLWPASWRTSDLVAKFGDLDAAYAIEDAIASAAITPAQNYLSEARRALLKGDLSTFVQMARRAEPLATPAEQRYGARGQLRSIMRMLDLPFEERGGIPPRYRGPLMEALAMGRLPKPSQFTANNASGANFWKRPPLVELALWLFVRDGREAELAEYYDAAFPTRADFVEFTRQEEQAHNIIPSVSPYLVLAFRKLGREEDAAFHLRLLREQVARWKASGTPAIDGLVYQLMLAALEEDKARFAALVQRLPAYGWPYTMTHVRPTTIMMLNDDPLYASVRDLPQMRRILDPIRANLAKEREEVLALGI